ncbi:hypothetical protein B0T13DRAFT_408315 [Neurospora crassa]|nr:hypothetical protein B0T13DRAFT_408315 [Neurospora crassa]
MTYDWDPYKDICHRLYVDERRSFAQVARYMAENHGFTPSRRTYWYKFREWGWPIRVNKAYSNTELIARVKELWEQNLKATEMVRVLNEEGYDINDRTLNRIRQKYNWKLRLKTIQDLRKGIIRPPGQPANGTDDDDNNGSDGDSDSADGSDNESEEVSSEEDKEDDEEEENATEDNGQGLSNTHGQRQHQQQQHQKSASASLPLGPDDELTPEQRARREERRRVLEQESAERWALKKRRRRTKGWAGLPPDPSGLPPRFPSETTLDEAKVILQLDAAAYKMLRENFEKICRENNVIKKTIAGPEKWEAMKEQMIRDSMHLRAIMWDQANMEQKKIAIDVICCDVTKRIRTMQSHMTLAQARNLLGLNPEQGRYIRGTLYLLLGQEKFGFKHVEGIDKWNEMVQKWFDTTELLQELFPPGCEHWPNAKERKRAIELLARDGMRRYRGDQAKLEKDALNPPPPKVPRKRAPPKPKPVSTPAQLEAAAKRAEKAAEKAAKAAQSKRGRGRPPKNNTAGPSTATATATATVPHTVVRLAPLESSNSEESEADQDAQDADNGNLDPDYLLQQSIEADTSFGSYSANTHVASGRGSAGANVGANTITAQASSRTPNLAQTQSGPQTHSQATQNYTTNRNHMQQSYATSNHGLTQSHTQSPPLTMYTQQQQQQQRQQRQQQQQQQRIQQEAIQRQARARQQHFQQTASVPPVQVSQPVATSSSTSTSSSMAIYFRLHASSPLQGVVSRIWIATLSGRSVQELRSTAVANYPGVVCLAIEGIVKDGKGGELPLPVSDDMEMEAYLQHIQGMGSGAPTFSVMLVPAATAATAAGGVGGSW